MKQPRFNDLLCQKLLDLRKNARLNWFNLFWCYIDNLTKLKYFRNLLMCNLMTLENGNGSCWITNENLLFAEHNCLRLLVSNRWFGHLSKTFCDWEVNAWTLWVKNKKVLESENERLQYYFRETKLFLNCCSLCLYVLICHNYLLNCKQPNFFFFNIKFLFKK